MLGQEAQVRHRALLVSCVPPRCSFTAAAPRPSLTCRGGEETIVAPAQEEKVQPAGPGVHSSGWCPGTELSSPVCSQGTGAGGSPGGSGHPTGLCWVSPESSWGCCRAGTPEPPGECRALHPFTPWITTSRPTSLFGKAPGHNVCFPSGTRVSAL